MSSRSALMRRAALWLACAPVCFLGAMVATGAEARENYALIVADSDYPNLDEKYWLKGPKNDEVLVRDYLVNNAPVKFEPQNVIALGSGDGLQLGTHQNILDNLAKIASEAKAGDFVYLHFSGHGSQEPAKNDKTEADGRDEVFLAADTEMAPPDDPSYFPNVLTDDEVSGALKAIRKTGAFVWVVFDSCHSGTMTRGAPDAEGTADRKIDPADLGIPDSAFTQPAQTDDSSRAVPLAGDAYGDDDNDPNLGGIVAFFAAQTTETTQERPFDVQQPDGSIAHIPYGVFTYTIFQALAKNPNQTYRQLAQSVLAEYTAENATKPTPLFEGKLDAPVFGNADAADAEQWPVTVAGDKSLTISAGQLYGLAAGSKLLLLASPSASDDQAIGLMQVATSTQLRSTIVPSSDDKHSLIDASAVPAGAYVRLAELNYPFELVVSKPDPAGADPAQLAAVQAALDQIMGEANKPLKLDLVDAGQPADVKLAVLSELQVAKLAGATATASDPTPKLWLLPATGEVSLDPGRRAPSIALPQLGGATTTAGADADFSRTLEQTLVTIFRATGLSRLTQANTFKPRDFSLTFGLQAAGASSIATLAPEETPVIRPKDRLYIDFTNAAGKAVDLNVLYIDHDYGITLLCQTHLAPNDHLFQPMADVTGTDRGGERIVAVINESGKDLTDLSFLTQPGIPPAKRGLAEPGSLLGMLADLGDGTPTRGPTLAGATDSKTPRGAVVMVPVEVAAGTGQEAAAEIAPDDPRQPEGSCTG